MPLLEILAASGLALILLAAIDLLYGNRTIRDLNGVSPSLREPPPKVSIVVAVRNEERHLGAALSSLLALDYPDLEVIVVNDRSSDRSGEILAQLAAGDTRLAQVEISELPPGWLGKNHALWCGSQRAHGDLLLFTDADIFMEKTLLARAVNLLQREQLDHLVVSPHLDMPSTLLSMFGLAFMMIFALFSRPWKARDPNSRYHIGIGAFNLVRTSAYRACGGHRRIAMRPDDDLKLGKLLKQSGFRQDIAAGPDFMRVEWYASMRELIRGLEKNAFAGCDYRLSLALAGVGGILAFSVWPFAALLLTSGTTWWLNLASAGMLLGLQVDCARSNRLSAWYAFGWPLGATLFAWIILRTTWLNLLQGGITWRGTFYPLKELKKNRV